MSRTSYATKFEKQDVDMNTQSIAEEKDIVSLCKE